MATIRKPRIVKQIVSEPPPSLVEMKCQCGQIFSESQKLTAHMFQKHIYSPEFDQMKSIAEQLSTIGQFHKSEINNNQKMKEKQYRAVDSRQVLSLSTYAPLKKTKNRAKNKQIKQSGQLENGLDQSLGVQSKQQNYKAKIEGKGPPQASFPTLSQSSNDAKQNQKTAIRLGLEKQPKRQRQHTRQFYNSRTFMCGECLTVFVYSAELNVHVSVKHNGQYPDGTIFGFKKHQILNFFKIPTQKPVYPQMPERQRKYKCGCGYLYAASASLMNHIKLRHNSVAPPGTINLPQTKRIKKLVVDNPDFSNGV